MAFNEGTTKIAVKYELLTFSEKNTEEDIAYVYNSDVKLCYSLHNAMRDTMWSSFLPSVTVLNVADFSTII